MVSDPFDGKILNTKDEFLKNYKKLKKRLERFLSLNDSDIFAQSQINFIPYCALYRRTDGEHRNRKTSP